MAQRQSLPCPFPRIHPPFQSVFGQFLVPEPVHTVDTTSLFAWSQSGGPKGRPTSDEYHASPMADLDHHYLPPIMASQSTPSPCMSAVTPKEWPETFGCEAIILETPLPHAPPKQSYQQIVRADSPALTHLVPPEAIRVAEQEEQEEAMGSTNHQPFLTYPSFLLMKHMHSQTQVATSPSFPISYSPTLSLNSNSTLYQPTHQDQCNLTMHPQRGNEQVDALGSIAQLSSSQKRLKRPPNAYLLFNRAMRHRLLEESPKRTVAEISKEIGDRWKVLEQSERDRYIEEARMLKEDHQREHPDFIYTRRSKAELADSRRFKGGKTTDSNGICETNTAKVSKQKKPKLKNGRDPRGRKKKQDCHPSGPKHPMSGFLFYAATVRGHVAATLPGSTIGPISKIIGANWRAMTAECRLPFLEKATADKARYAKEMQYYMASVRSKGTQPNEVDDEMVATVSQMVNHNQQLL
ncbi:high mobility group box domain-containing protein [Phycomyces blakesleeanus]|uniref:High mobility group box domain-containing protein n=1 Tax=Phycomyces blakesleeanus TaxID=4837 RepID=A0ABR3B5L0_PHYBL